MNQSMPSVPLEKYDVDPVRGFLPAKDPLVRLPEEFAAWDLIAAQLPKHLVIGRGRTLLEQVPQLDTDALRAPAELERAMLLLSYFGHAWINDSEPPAQSVPANIAVPWAAVAARLGRPPILSYATQQLHNWRRVDGDRPVELGNIIRLQDFLGGLDDDWFVIVHIAIEAAAGPGLLAAVQAQDAVLSDDAEQLADALRRVAQSLAAMQTVLARMPEGCDPYIYYNRVRRFLFGWKNNPAFPQGISYEGVEAFGGRPQEFSGETGAQSAIVPFLDTVFGISDEQDPLADYMMSLRAYLPPAHRAFVEEVGTRVDLRGHLLERRPAEAVAAYNECIESMHAFRELHLRYAAQYVQQQAQRDASNSNEVGTGGTPFMRYLRRHLDNVLDHVIR
ncbi:hypothetical protein AB0B50_27430 [Streptomyces sp. NPDC041068]|uniref:hypothetical protein n=1 Tax=Streptomyces sp. NPDC041068 TaxID=3155130 RepID=UPI0033FF9268